MGEPRTMLSSCHWVHTCKTNGPPRPYSFTNTEGKVFYEIAYSRQDVNTFAKMHKATSYKPTVEGSIRNQPFRVDPIKFNLPAGFGSR